MLLILGMEVKVKKLIFVLFLTGCATTGLFRDDEVNLDYKNTWVSSMKEDGLRRITLRVVNTKKYDVSVSVSCRYDGKCFSTSRIFGENVVKVEANSVKVFIIAGFHDGGLDSNHITCKITKVE